jgi:hypothetical protein
MMHGQKTIKLCNAEQTKQVYQCKNTKIKLYKNNAAIWYNKDHSFFLWDVKYTIVLLKMSTAMLETCRGS